MTDLLAEAVAATDWKRNPHKTAAGQAAALRAALRERGVRLVTVESLRKALPEDWEPFWEEMPVIGNAEGFREHAVEFNHERFAAAILQALDSA